MKVSLFEISYQIKLFHDIIIFLDAPVYTVYMNNCTFENEPD